MKVDIELDEDQERNLVWKRCKEDLQLGISSSLISRKPYVCGYLFAYRENAAGDIGAAVKKMRLISFLRGYIVDLAFCYESEIYESERWALCSEMGYLVEDLHKAYRLAKAFVDKWQKEEHGDGTLEVEQVNQ